MSNRIAIEKTDHEGMFEIDALTGRVVTANDERPEWADGLAVALLGERTGWYEQRLGTELPEAVRKPQRMNFADLGWIAFDHNGDEVEIDADLDYRMDVLAGQLSVDRSDLDMERNFKNDLVIAEATHTYKTDPNSEETLAEAEGHTFGQEHRTAVGE